jgi:beta-N-acetylhexosaminidase
MVVTYFAPRIKDAGTIVELIKTRETGGVIFFENSNREIARLTGVFTQASLRSSSLLLPVYAIDGEPSYMQQRIGRSMRLHVSEEISTVEEANKTAGTIALLLKKMGIHINYAPVCDIAYNREVIGLRSFGTDIDRVSRLSQAFIESTQSNGIVATAKHFPGHGSSEGDTHKRLVFIDGDPPELPVFEHVIEAGVISVMVGHVGVKNAGALDTGDKPSTLSRNIVTDLLKKQLGFKGIVVTDAMTMKAVRPFSMSSYRAVRAGCDMVLMPDDEELFMTKMRDEIRTDAEFREQVMESIRKIVRLKVCLGLINTDEQKKRTI